MERMIGDRSGDLASCMPEDPWLYFYEDFFWPPMISRCAPIVVLRRCSGAGSGAAGGRTVGAALWGCVFICFNVDADPAKERHLIFLGRHSTWLGSDGAVRGPARGSNHRRQERACVEPLVGPASWRTCVDADTKTARRRPTKGAYLSTSRLNAAPPNYLPMPWLYSCC